MQTTAVTSRRRNVEIHPQNAVCAASKKHKYSALTDPRFSPQHPAAPPEHGSGGLGAQTRGNVTVSNNIQTITLPVPAEQPLPGRHPEGRWGPFEDPERNPFTTETPQKKKHSPHRTHRYQTADWLSPHLLKKIALRATCVVMFQKKNVEGCD